MGILDRLFGRREEVVAPRRSQRVGRRSGLTTSSGTPADQLTDQQAIERYRYLLRTAPPETIEQAHAEAFSQLTPEQRRVVLQELSTALPEHEQVAGARNSDDPESLARMATRAELRRPGTLERTFGGMTAPGMGIGMGGLMAGSFLSSFAGVMLGSMIAQSFLADSGYDEGFAEGYGAGDAEQGGQEANSAEAGAYDDPGVHQADYADAGDDFGTDFGGDFGGFGGDMGGDF